MFFHGTRVESDKFHVISPCMGCTCPFYGNSISVRAKMSGLSTIKGDVLTILQMYFVFLTGLVSKCSIVGNGKAVFES